MCRTVSSRDGVFSVVLYCGGYKWPYPHLNQMICQHAHLCGAKEIKSNCICWLLCMYSWEKLFFHPQKFVTYNFFPILNSSKAEPQAFFFEVKRGRKAARALLLWETRELIWLTGDLASSTALPGPHWGPEHASSRFPPRLPSSHGAGLLTRW